MQNRIDRLEGLVLSLMTNGTQSVGPTAANAALSRSQSDSITSSVPPRQDSYDDDNMIKEETEDESEVEGVTNSLGVMKVDESQGKAMYIGESHWHLVLADVSTYRSILPPCRFLRVHLKHNYQSIRIMDIIPFEIVKIVEFSPDILTSVTISKTIFRYRSLRESLLIHYVIRLRR